MKLYGDNKRQSRCGFDKKLQDGDLPSNTSAYREVRLGVCRERERARERCGLEERGGGTVSAHCHVHEHFAALFALI